MPHSFLVAAQLENDGPMTACNNTHYKNTTGGKLLGHPNSGLTKTFRDFWGDGTRILVGKTELVLLLIVSDRTKLTSPFHRRRHEKKNMKIYNLKDKLKKLTPTKDGRRGETQLRRPSHKFKFWSIDIALNTISDEAILMNQISVEPIWMNQISVQPILMNQIFVEPI